MLWLSRGTPSVQVANDQDLKKLGERGKCYRGLLTCVSFKLILLHCCMKKRGEGGCEDPHTRQLSHADRASIQPSHLRLKERGSNAPPQNKRASADSRGCCESSSGARHAARRALLHAHTRLALPPLSRRTKHTNANATPWFIVGVHPT